MIKHIMTTLFVAVMMLSMSVTSFAAGNDNVPAEASKATLYNIEVTSNGIASISKEYGSNSTASVRSSMSGYEQKTLSGNPDGVIVYADASGIGGMGATVEASSSWNGYMNLDIVSSDGKTKVTGLSVPSNGTWKLDDVRPGGVTHYSPAYFVFAFRGIPEGQSVFVKIWIYG